MWAPIFSQNRDNILTVLDTYIDKLKEFRSLIDNGDIDNLKSLVKESNRIKRVLK